MNADQMKVISKFQDRRDAGKKLAVKLGDYKGSKGVFILALLRGGIVVADEIAKKLNIPLIPFFVRKVGLPWNKEIAMGAVAEGGEILMNQNLIKVLKISQQETKKAIEHAQKELQIQKKLYSQGNLPSVDGMDIILVDDGLATGMTMLVAVRALKRTKVKKIIIAAPVGDSQVCEMLNHEVDELICLLKPKTLDAIGCWYYDFDQVTDKEVIECLTRR